ncbi:MAG: hypothetical protein PHR52_11690 [Fermentimonas sp.]|nr:hypothetical protein [Fermentimonas sp.]MDD4698184.1 hypothetical protein [Fermentimonas sp.]
MKESIKKEIKDVIHTQMLELFIVLQDGFEVNMYPGSDTADYMADAALAVFMGAVDVKEKETGKEYNGIELTKSSSK